MSSVLGGIIMMLLIAVIAGVGMNTQFSQSSGDAFSSENGSVRLGK